ncbi:deuterosome assembly protein 1 [Leptodactylus fuscus]
MSLYSYSKALYSGVSCEKDLEELMHQIDIMVNSKKVEWEKQVLVLEQRLEAQEQELTNTRCALDQKDCEIRVLLKKLEDTEKNRQDVVQNYESQLEALKNQLCKLKKSYDKLQYYGTKNNKKDTSPDHEKSQSELQWMSQRLEEYKDQARQWENQRLIYQDNMQTLSEQRKNLLEKCEYLQKQSQSYEEQLSGRTQLQDQAITNNQSEIRRLRCQLDASQETARSGRVIIENLKSTVKEITLSRNALKDENQRLLQQLRDCQKQCQRTENKLCEATIELQAREDLSRAAELDQRQLCKFSLQNSQNKHLSSQVSNVFTNKRTPNRDKVQKRLRLSPCKQDQAEKDSAMKESECTGLERLQEDVSDLTEKLHQKDITIASISQKVSRLERELDMKVLRQQGRKSCSLIQEVRSLLEISGDLTCFNISHIKSNLSVFKPSEDSCDFHEQTQKPEMENCSDDHKVEGAKPEKMKANTWQREMTGKPSQDKLHRSCKEGEQTLKMADKESHHLDSHQPCDSLLVDQECLDVIMPILGSPTRNNHHYPEIDFTDFSLIVCDQSENSTTLPGTEESFVSAAERFLQEEDRRALDFENLLNLHIEELQRYSAHTVRRYTSPHYAGYHPAPS